MLFDDFVPHDWHRKIKFSFNRIIIWVRKIIVSVSGYTNIDLLSISKILDQICRIYLLIIFWFSSIRPSPTEKEDYFWEVENCDAFLHTRLIDAEFLLLITSCLISTKFCFFIPSSALQSHAFAAGFLRAIVNLIKFV